MLGNGSHGLYLVNGPNGNTIGGTTAAARNVISGNDFDGVAMFGADGNVVQGNYIGTDGPAPSTLGTPGTESNMGPANGNVIGGTVAGARNVISGNGGSGITPEW